MDVTESSDPEGLRVFYYLVQDLKALIFSLISLHFKVRAFHDRMPDALLTIPLIPTDQAHLNHVRLGPLEDEPNNLFFCLNDTGR